MLVKLDHHPPILVKQNPNIWHETTWDFGRKLLHDDICMNPRLMNHRNLFSKMTDPMRRLYVHIPIYEYRDRPHGPVMGSCHLKGPPFFWSEKNIENHANKRDDRVLLAR